MTSDIGADARLILDHQHPGGAYVASPGFSQYPYCWLRDGSFVAHAMDVAGEHESARRFHGWAARAVLGIAPGIRALVEAADRDEPIDHARMPPARFTLAGVAEEDDWPNFQVDGYGQWLWSLGEHARATSAAGRDAPLPDGVLAAARVVAEYLARFWNEPCFDAWEEGRTQLHTSTLASACAGLRAAGAWIDPTYAAVADEAWGFILDRCVAGGRFVKRVRSRAVDASLLWLSTPFDLVSDQDPLFEETLAAIELELVCDGGVLRYPEDTFYGGGAWILLTAWLAWHHARNGRPDRARPYLEWIEGRRTEHGGLAEQVPCARTDAWFLRYWTQRWGTSATPLLWSHAMTILAHAALVRRSD